MKFDILSKDSKSKARTGKIILERGVINTPIFMPVGTLGTVRGIHQSELINDIKAEIILGNTYHLYLRPNLDVIKNSDWVIDLGPEGGENGGKIVSEGTPESIATDKTSLTGHHLKSVL